MRKLLSIILAVLYISFTSGVVLSTHYCMGQVAAVALGSSGEDTCGNCGMENEGCCHDDVQVMKLTTDHSASAMTSLPVPVVLEMETTWNLLPVRPILPAKIGTVQIHGPPTAVHLNILHCIYRI
jgi:hypothetical protein